MGAISENLERVRERVQRAAAAAGRRADDVLVVAVSKTFPAEAIAEAADAGQRCFGENRVQEAELKIPSLRDRDLEWHLIGHLQSNKVRRAAQLFDTIQSVDNTKVASRISEAALALGKRIPVLVQVELGQEETKFGTDPQSVNQLMQSLASLQGIRVEGLMTIPPFFERPDDARPYFARLREIRDSLVRQNAGSLGKGHLSMGMSHDFEAAILEGATMIRVGTAIFGERS